MSVEKLRTELAAAGDKEIYSSHRDHCDDGKLKGNPFGVANDPHPVLEVPVLYHLLAKKCPRALEWVKPFYSWRWWMSYPLAHQVPGCVFLIKYFKVSLTLGEFLLLVPFVAAAIACIYYTFADISVAATGKLARGALIASFLFATRNSWLTLFLGIPIDRTHFYHKLAGILAAVATLLHTLAFFLDPKFQSVHQDDKFSGAFTGKMNISGSFMTTFVFGITVTCLPAIKKKLFEVWHAIHQVMCLALVVGAFYHTGFVVPILAFVTWGLDRIGRHYVSSKIGNPVMAKLKAISPKDVQLTFSKTSAFAYNAGQYVWVSIPELSVWQWHPLSLCSAPSQDKVTIRVRKAGNWSTSLYELAKTNGTVTIYVDGPYGSLSVDIMGDRKYKTIMMISGGIGVTPMISICNQLLYETTEKCRDIRRIQFIWVDREESLLEQLEYLQNPDVIDSINASSNPVPQSVFLPNTVKGSSERVEKLCDGTVCIDKKSKTISEVLNLRLYWTGKSENYKVPIYLKLGRPDLETLFEEIKKEAKDAGEKKIAVLASAPKALLERTKVACILHSDDDVRFDYHSESIIN